MAHEEVNEENLSHEEILYRYHIQRGSDYMKIDLFRSARETYKEALQYKPGDSLATENIAVCNQYINRDRKKVLIIVPVVMAIILGIILFNL
jgi:hypothetical protein